MARVGSCIGDLKVVFTRKNWAGPSDVVLLGAKLLVVT